MKHFKVVAFAFAVLGLGACTEAQKDDAFAIACTSVSVADTGFGIYAQSGKVSADVVKAEAAAVAGAQATCDGPRPTDTRTVLAAVNRALRAIADATSRARSQVSGS